MFRSAIPASKPLRPFSGRVLLTHDDDMERVQLGARLSELGLQVRFLSTAVEWVETTLRHPPAVALIGLDQDSLGGADAVAHLRERGYAGLVVGLLRDPWPMAEEHVREVGCDHALEVDVKILELKLKLRAWMEQSAVQSAAAHVDVATGGWQQMWRRLTGRPSGGRAVA